MSTFLLPGGGTLATTGLPLYAPVLSGPSPNAPLAGQFWYDPTAHEFKFQDNTETIVLGTSTTPGLPAVIAAGGDATTLQGVTADGPNAGLLFQNTDNQFFDTQGRAWVAVGLDAGTDYTVRNLTINANLVIDVLLTVPNITVGSTITCTNYTFTGAGSITSDGMGITISVTNNGILKILGLPASDPVQAGQAWLNSGVLTVSTG